MCLEWTYCEFSSISIKSIINIVHVFWSDVKNSILYLFMLSFDFIFKNYKRNIERQIFNLTYGTLFLKYEGRDLFSVHLIISKNIPTLAEILICRNLKKYKKIYINCNRINHLYKIQSKSTIYKINIKIRIQSFIKKGYYWEITFLCGGWYLLGPKL